MKCSSSDESRLGEFFQMKSAFSAAASPAFEMSVLCMRIGRSGSSSLSWRASLRPEPSLCPS